MKRRSVIIIAVLVVLGLIIGALVWLIPSSAPVAQAQEHEVVETLVATGQVVPQSRTVLISEVASEVSQIAIQEGDSVSKDEVLIVLDDGDAQASLRQAEAAVAEARARLNSVTDQGASTAREDLAQARLNLDAAREDYQRAQGLFEAGVIPRVEVDEARRLVERAESDVQRAQTALDQTAQQGSSFAEASAAVQRAESERQRAELQLDNFLIRAPADGEILRREVEPGTAVQPGTVLATLALEGPLHIEVNPDESELANLSTEQPAQVVTDAFPDRQFSASVYRINPSVDPERGTVTVALRIDDPPSFLRVDMTATVEIELNRKQEALVVPRAAVRDLATDSPWVLQFQNGRAQRVDVEVGLQDERYAEITAGLNPGDEVAVDPELEPGERVRTGDPYIPAAPGGS